MAYLQIVEFHTRAIEKGKQLVAKWEQATAGRSRARSRVLGQDRDDQTHFFSIVVYSSYEEAMATAALPETTQLADELLAITTGPTNYYAVDIIDKVTYE
jgi:hypothetical protein